MAEWVKVIVLTVLFVRAVYTDIKEGKIENPLIIAGLAAGLWFAYIRGGAGEIFYSVKMTGTVFLLLFFLFVIKGLGAGDIKLLCVAAAFFPEKAISIVIVSFFIGAALGAGKMAMHWMRKEMFSIKKETVHFSIPIAVGALLMYFGG